MDANNPLQIDGEKQTGDLPDHTFDAYIVIDADSRILEWNAQAARLFGWSRAKPLGLNLTDTIIPPQHRLAHLAGVRHYLATGQGPVVNRRLEITALHREGRQFSVELQIWARPADAGEAQFHAFVRDVGERVQANRQLAAQTMAAAALIESDSIDDAGPKLLQAIASALGWAVGALWMVDADNHTLRCAELWRGGDARMAGFERTSRSMTFASGIGRIVSGARVSRHGWPTLPAKAISRAPPVPRKPDCMAHLDFRWSVAVKSLA